MTAGLLPWLAATLATVALVTAAGILKFAAFFINLLVPVPVAILTLRYSGILGAAAVAAAWGGLTLSGEAQLATLYLAQFTVASLILPLALKRLPRWDAAVGVTLLLMLATLLLLLFGYASSQGTSLDSVVKSYIGGEIDQVKTLYLQEDLPAEQRDALLAVLDKTSDFLIATWPGFLTCFSGVLLLVEVLLLKSIPAVRPLVPGPLFATWKSPEPLVWLLIVAGFGAFLNNSVIGTLAANLLVVVLPIYYMHGLAIVSYFFQTRGIAPLLRTFGYLLLFMLNPLPLLVAGLGLFDMWADFRKPRTIANQD